MCSRGQESHEIPLRNDKAKRSCFRLNVLPTRLTGCSESITQSLDPEFGFRQRKDPVPSFLPPTRWDVVKHLKHLIWTC